MNKVYTNLLTFLLLKLTLMYLIRAWCRWSLKDMQKRGVVLPIHVAPR